eukprot:883707-Rhodomonas_salina.1
MASKYLRKRQGEGPCLILSLPDVLLAAVWPDTRAVVGMRVCKQLRERLGKSNFHVALEVKRWRSKEVTQDQLTMDLSLFSAAQISIDWCAQSPTSWDTLMTALSSSGCASRLKSLRSKIGGGTKLGADGAQRLAEVLGECTSLMRLGLGVEALGSSGAASLASVIERNKSLNFLDLTHNEIGPHGAETLAKVIPQCPALSTLWFGSNSFGSTGARCLAGVLGMCEALTNLNLLDNDLSKDGADALAGVLGECKSLTHIRLGQNGFGPEGAESLASGLAECQALRNLEFGFNGIRTRGAKALALALPKCKALTHLDLLFNDIGPPGAKSLAIMIASKAVMSNNVEEFGGCAAFMHVGLKGNCKECERLSFGTDDDPVDAMSDSE